jgi:hypothetical protein
MVHFLPHLIREYGYLLNEMLENNSEEDDFKLLSKGLQCTWNATYKYVIIN